MKTNIQFKNLFNASLFAALTIFISLNLNSQTITTIAGTGVNGSLGDGAAATAAQLSFPVRVIFDAAGNLYIADHTNHRIRKITPAGIISTCVGTGTAGYGGDGGLATAAQISFPVGVVFDAAGNMYIADRSNHRIRKVTPAGIISTVAGTTTSGFSGDGGLATSAQLFSPFGVAVDAAGNIYIGDSNNNRIRKVNTSGIISTIAGTISAGFSGDGGPATSAQLSFPTGVRVDATGNVYIADFNNNRLRKIDLSGNMSTVAGTNIAGFSGDGAAANLSQLNTPYDVNFDVAGNIYIVDSGNNRVRKISAGIISTIAGTISAGFSGDGGLATNAQLNNPAGVAFDATGNVFIADYNNNRIRKITCAQPTISVASSTNVICLGQSATLTASGGSTYTWNPAGNGVSISISPTVTSNYTVTGTNSVTGCSNSTVITQNVTNCSIGLSNNSIQQNAGLKIYPNPSNGEFSISSTTNINLNVINELGQLIMKIELSDKNDHQIIVKTLQSGIYFIHGNDGSNTIKEKVVLIK